MNEEEELLNTMFGSQTPKKVGVTVVIAVVLVLFIIILMCYYYKNTVKKASFVEDKVDKSIPALIPEDKYRHYDNHPDSKYNVTYKYEEQKDNTIKSDPGENVLFSSAHANIMDDYPVQI